MSGPTAKVSTWRFGMVAYSGCMLLGLAGLLWSAAWLVSSVEAMGSELVRKAEFTEAQMRSITSGTSIGSWLMQGHDSRALFWIVVVSALSIYGCAMLIWRGPAQNGSKAQEHAA